MKFNSKEELLTRAKKDGACIDAVEWAEGKELDEILRDICFGWRYWALMFGYEQFAEDCHWDELTRGGWV